MAGNALFSNRVKLTVILGDDELLSFFKPSSSGSSSDAFLFLLVVGLESLAEGLTCFESVLAALERSTGLTLPELDALVDDGECSGDSLFSLCLLLLGRS